MGRLFRKKITKTKSRDREYKLRLALWIERIYTRDTTEGKLIGVGYGGWGKEMLTKIIPNLEQGKKVGVQLFNDLVQGQTSTQGLSR